MEKNDLKSPHYEELYDRIFDILAVRGLSHTTMDYLTRELTISKRTLYEIFGSKDEMIKTILDRMERRHSDEMKAIMKHSSNVMEGLAQILLCIQNSIQKLSVNFFRDMDIRYKYLRQEYDKYFRRITIIIAQAIKLGIRQGVLREDVNYSVTLPLFFVQMESLKRMEELFPPQITLIEAYRTIALGTLRSIATEKGMEIIEKNIPKYYSKE